MSHPDPSTSQAWPLFRLFVDGAAASCIAEALTLPLEVGKMRLQEWSLQLQRNDTQLPQQTRYNGIMHAVQTMVKEEKWHSLFKGLEAGMHKQILYTGLRLGLYDYLTDFSSGEEEVSMSAKIACATMTTGIGILLANPSDVVQTRYIAHRSPSAVHSCADSGRPSAPVSRVPVSATAANSGGQQTRQCSTSAAVGNNFISKRYMNSAVVSAPLHLQTTTGGRKIDVYHSSCRQSISVAHTWRSNALRGSHSACSVHGQKPSAGGPKSVTGVPLANARSAYGVILREEGLVNGLYRGIAANLSCSCVQGAAEITTYDMTKDAALKRGFPDSVPLHLAAGTSAGLVATVVSNPLDVVATRMMAAKNAQCMQKSTLGTILDIWQREGIRAFYNGFIGNVLRITSFNVVLWLSYEQIRKTGKELVPVSN